MAAIVSEGGTDEESTETVVGAVVGDGGTKGGSSGGRGIDNDGEEEGREAVTMNEDGDGFTEVEGEVERECREGRVEATAVLAMFDDGGEGRGQRGGEASAVDGVRRLKGRSRGAGERGGGRQDHDDKDEMVEGKQ